MVIYIQSGLSIWTYLYMFRILGDKFLSLEIYSHVLATNVDSIVPNLPPSLYIHTSSYINSVLR